MPGSSSDDPRRVRRRGTTGGTRSPCSRRSRARRAPPRRASSMYQPPPQKNRGSSPRSRSHAASRADARGRVAAGRPRVRRRRPVRVVAERPARGGDPGAREPAARRLSPVGGRPHQRRDREAAGPRGLQRGEAPPSSASSSGRSTWQETTAYRVHDVLMTRCAGSADSSRRRARPTRRSSSAMNAALVHRGPDEGSRRRVRPLRARPPPPAGDRPRDGQPAGRRTRPATSSPSSTASSTTSASCARELEAQGHEVRGTGDTPVIPHLYEEHGVGFVERLDGMFALALWDARARAARARARPRRQEAARSGRALPDGTLAFASELKALLRAPRRLARARPGARSTRTSRCSTCPGGTALARHREAAARARCSSPRAARCDVERYWRLEPAEPRATSEWLELVRDEVDAAVRRRLVADVPLGALLSGGIDSSDRRRGDGAGVGRAGADVHGRLRRRRATTSARYARAVAERYGTEHEELVRRAGRRRARCRGSPPRSTSRSATRRRCRRFLVCEAARRHVTVALVGDGGDEAFAGYERYAAHGLAGRVALPGGAALAARALRRARARRSRARRAYRARPLPRGRGAAGRGALRAADGGLPGRAARRAAGSRRSSRAPTPAWRAARPAAAPGHRRAPAARRPHVPPRRPAAQGRHRLDGALARAALAAPRPPRASSSALVAARLAEARGRDGQGRAAARVRGRPAARGRRAAARPASASRSRAGSAGELRDARRATCCSTSARASAASSGPTAVERLLDEHVGGPRRPRPPALVPADARALAARRYVDAARPGAAVAA